MAEEQVIRLLEEIRDLQKLHVENYKDALKRQDEAIDLQKSAIRRQRVTVIVLVVLLAGFLVFMAWSSTLAKG